MKGVKLIMLDDNGKCYTCEYADVDEHDEPCIDCPARLRNVESKWKLKQK